MAATTYTKNKVLDYLFGKQAFTPADTIYAGLCTACDNAGTVTGEPSTTVGYDRIAITNNDVATVWSTASNGVKTNANGKIQFGTVTSSDWGTLPVFFLSDGSTAGNILWHSTMTAPLITSVGMAPFVDESNLTLTITT
jgi:hypothetical protein